jgi:hypothetical protein
VGVTGLVFANGGQRVAVRPRQPTGTAFAEVSTGVGRLAPPKVRAARGVLLTRADPVSTDASALRRAIPGRRSTGIDPASLWAKETSTSYAVPNRVGAR